MKNLRFKNQIALAVAALVCSSFVSAAPYTFRTSAPGIKPAPAPAVHLAVNFNATSTGRSGTIQTWTVPTTGTYTVVLGGASGGSITYTPTYTPGAGGVLTTQLALTQGTVLKILVGQVGEGSTYRAGGGGGTYVVRTNTLLAVAGGGGGAGNDGGSGYSSSMTATPYHGGATCNTGWGGGGAGFNADGWDGCSYGGLALSFMNGGTGGMSTGLPAGGFGGGGGGGGNGGGGGGGYTSIPGGGAGGVSYTSGTLISFAATNSGTGYASFTLN